MNESKTPNRKLHYYAIILALVVISIPLAYSATEPSIIINMIFGQSEKPLIIKDNLGTEIFSVDTDGTLFPTVGSPPLTPDEELIELRTELMFYESRPIQIHTLTCNPCSDDTDFIGLAEWVITWDQAIDEDGNEFQVLITDLHIASSMKSSGGTIRYGIYESEDSGTTFSSISLLVTSSVIFRNNDSDSDSLNICDTRAFGETCIIRVQFGSTIVAPNPTMDLKDAMATERIDLHGFDRVRARAQLNRSLASAAARNVGCVLIIHGRGQGSGEAGAVLKQALPGWLTSSPCAKYVRAFAPARQRDGGQGASYVLVSGGD